MTRLRAVDPPPAVALSASTAAPTAGLAELAGIASSAGGAGHESLWAGEHPPSRDLAGSADACPPDARPVDPIVRLSRLVGVAGRIGRDSVVVILPLRDPVARAGQLAPPGRFSTGGRVPGHGVGRVEPTFRATDVPSATTSERSCHSGPGLIVRPGAARQAGWRTVHSDRRKTQ